MPARSAEMDRLTNGHDRTETVGRARRRRGEVTQAALSIIAVGVIIALRRILRAPAERGAHQNARRIRRVKPEEFAGSAWPEIGVQSICAGRILDVEPRGENDQKAARLNCFRWKHP